MPDYDKIVKYLDSLPVEERNRELGKLSPSERSQLQDYASSGISTATAPKWNTVQPANKKGGGFFHDWYRLDKGATTLLKETQEHVFDPASGLMVGAVENLMPGKQSGEKVGPQTLFQNPATTLRQTGDIRRDPNLNKVAGVASDILNPTILVGAATVPKVGAMALEKAAAKGLVSKELAGAATASAEKIAAFETGQSTNPLLRATEKGLKIKRPPVESIQGPTAGVEIPPSAPAVSKMGDLQNFDELIRVNFTPDNATKIANLPGVRNIMGATNPAAFADDPVKQAIVGRQMLRNEGQQKGQGVIAHLNQLGNQEKVFGKLTKEGLIAEGPLKGLTPNTVRTFRGKYAAVMTPAQKTWVDTAQMLEAEKLDFLTRNNIKINELSFDEGGEYAGRRVYGMVNADGEILDTAYVGAGPGRPGAKLSVEKHRVFDTAEEATQAGYRYLPEDEALYFNIMGAYNKVADKQMADWLLEKIPWRTMETPEGAQIGAIVAKQKLDRANQLQAALNRATRGEKLPTATINSIAKSFPEEADMLRKVMIIRPMELDKAINKLGQDLWTELKITPKQFKSAIEESRMTRAGKLPLGKELRVPERAYTTGDISGAVGILAKQGTNAQRAMNELYQNMLVEIPKQERDALAKEISAKAQTLIKQSQGEYREAVNIRKLAREKSMRPTYTEASLHDIPAFAGKIFTGTDAKETTQLLRKSFTPGFNKALVSVNKVNAVARYFALAGDMSVGTIQLLFLAGSKPQIYGKSMAGFVKALMNPEYESRFLANNNVLIQNSRNLILTKSGSTEFTEAMAKGGWLHKGPAKVAGKVLEPFQRGFESALDTAGIELRKSYDHLCTTPERTAQVEQFINEFRGVTSSARIGVSPTQRQIETVVLLAPRYNRAIAALLFDVFRGNLRGQLARESLAKGITAVSAMAVAISIARGETEDEIIDHFNPNSPNFYTWDVAGQKIGPGTKVRSVVKLFANSAKNPDDLGKFSQENWMDNPIVKFGRGNTSPAISTGLDILTGKDYLGNPSRDNMLQVSKTVLAENLLPLWTQSVVLEGGTIPGKAISGVGQFGGLRTYPQSLWEVRDGLRDRYSGQMYQGKSWSGLNDAERDTILKANPDLVELDRKVKTEGLEKYGSEYERAEYLIKTERDAKFNSDMDNIAQLLESGQMTWSDYNESRREALNKRSAEKNILWDMKSILEKESVDAIQKYREKNRQPEDKAMDNYKAIFYDEPVRDENGLIDWGATYQKADAFLTNQPKELREYIETHEHDWINDLPAVAQQVEKTRLQIVKSLRPYWELEDAYIEQQFGADTIDALREEWNKLLQTPKMANSSPQYRSEYKKRFFGKLVIVDQAVAHIKEVYKIKHPDVAQKLRMWDSQ